MEVWRKDEQVGVGQNSSTLSGVRPTCLMRIPDDYHQLRAKALLYIDVGIFTSRHGIMMLFISHIIVGMPNYRPTSRRSRPAAVEGPGSGQLPTASSTSSKNVVLL